MNHWIWFALGAASFLLNDLIWELWKGYRVRRKDNGLDAHIKIRETKAMAEVVDEDETILDEENLLMEYRHLLADPKNPSLEDKYGLSLKRIRMLEKQFDGIQKILGYEFT